jgi:hypothetical protein
MNAIDRPLPDVFLLIQTGTAKEVRFLDVSFSGIPVGKTGRWSVGQATITTVSNYGFFAFHYRHSPTGRLAQRRKARHEQHVPLQKITQVACK